MIESKIATEQDIGPFGMRCPYCPKEIAVGDEIVSSLSGMIDDIPVVVLVCGECGPKLDTLVPCPHCDQGIVVVMGHAEGCWNTGNCERNGCPVPVQEQCPTCRGAGEVFPESIPCNETDKP